MPPNITTLFTVDGASADSSLLGRLRGHSLESQGALEFFLRNDTLGILFPAPGTNIAPDTLPLNDTTVILVRRCESRIWLDDKETRVVTTYHDTFPKITEPFYGLGLDKYWQLKEIGFGHRGYRPNGKRTYPHDEAFVPLRIDGRGRLALRDGETNLDQHPLR